MADQHLQETASRIAVYAAGDGPCSCGQIRGHSGWLVCVLGPSAPLSHPVSDSEHCACGGFWRGAVDGPYAVCASCGVTKEDPPYA